MFRYTWKLYSERLMTLTGVYGFWKYVSNLERRETRRYLEMFYALKYRRPQPGKLPEESNVHQCPFLQTSHLRPVFSSWMQAAAVPLAVDGENTDN
jgi:hypothetical protein